MDCLNRTNIDACSTIGTFFRINYINVAFRYCFLRTFIDTCTACCTFIIYKMCHFDRFLIVKCCKVI